MSLFRTYTRYHDPQTRIRHPGCPDDHPGFSGMQARFLLTADDGCPRYAMRLMEIAPGGHCSFHNHKKEHEMYFLEGEGILRTDAGNECGIRAGDALLLMPCELHQIRNTGTGMLKNDLHGSDVTREDR